MLRRLGSKASLSSSSYGAGGRSAMSATGASGFALRPLPDGARGSRYCNEIKDLAASLWKRSYVTGQWARSHTLTVPLTQSMQLKGNELCCKTKSSGPYSSGVVDDDDDFSELGPSLQDDTGSAAELERQDTANCLPSRNSDLEVHSNVSRTNSEAVRLKNGGTKNGNLCRLSSVVIYDLLPDISIMELRDAGSVFGEILNVNIRTGKDGLTSGYINFKYPASREKALAAGSISVGGCRLPFHEAQGLKHVTVRISNISMDMAEPAIHTICRSCGSVTSLARTKEGEVDVVFGVEDGLMIPGIVNQRTERAGGNRTVTTFCLNNVSMDGRQWSAKLLPQNSQNWKKKNISTSERSVASQISTLMGDLRKKLRMQKIYLEDLEQLHHAVLHLKEQPAEK